MRPARFSLALLLILALVPMMSAIASQASGQSMTTITTIATTSELYTYPAATIVQTSTETTSIYGAGSGIITSGFTLNICGQGAQYNETFDATKGQGYRVEWETKPNAPIDLYILHQYPAESYDCGNFPKALALAAQKGGSGSMDWVAPSSGKYNLWLWNFGSSSVAGIFTISTLATTTLATTTITSSSVSLVIATTTQLVSLTTALQSAGFQLPFGNLGLMGAGGVLAVVVVALVLVVARRRKTAPTPALQQQSRPAVQEPRTDTATQPTIRTGYPDLDNALEGGIPERFGVIIVSPSYDERDLLLRKVIESTLSSGRLVIFVSNDIGRSEDLASRYSRGFYAFCSQADKIPSHGPNLVRVPTIDNLSDANLSLSLAIKDLIAKEGKTKPLIIIDILSDVLLRHKSITTRKWLSDFVGKRKAEGFTILATLNPLTTTKEETQSIIDFFDGVIEIFEKPVMERSRRFLIIKKMYGRRYSESEVLMDKDKLF